MKFNCWNCRWAANEDGECQHKDSPHCGKLRKEEDTDENCDYFQDYEEYLRDEAMSKAEDAYYESRWMSDRDADRMADAYHGYNMRQKGW